MIQFQHNDNTSEAEIIEAETHFRLYLGDFITEFEKNKPFVTINHNEPINSEKRFSFVFGIGNADLLFSFINRFNKAKKSSK